MLMQVVWNVVQLDGWLWEIKANIAPESYKKGTDIEENLHFVVLGAMRSIWKSV